MSKFAPLIFLAGFLVQLPSISAQEAAFNEESVIFDQQGGGVDPLRAAEQALSFGDDSSSSAPGTGTDIWAVVRMVLVLALAAAAIYGIVFLFKRASKPAQNTDPFLKVLANAHLGSNRYVHVVSVGNKTWLLGASEGGVNVIGEIEDTDIINAMLLEDSRKTAQTPGRMPDFLSMLRRMGTPAQGGAPGADEIRKRRERLKGL